MQSDTNVNSNTTSWQSSLLRIQDIDHRDFNAMNPELVKAAIKHFEDAADSLDANDPLVDSKVEMLAKEAARINIGETNTSRLVAIIADERKVGGGKVAVKKVFSEAKAKKQTASGQDMGAEWQARWDEMTESMNENHANVIMGGRNVIVRFGTSPLTGGQIIEYIPPRELAGAYLHDQYVVGRRKDGEEIERNRIDAWVTHPAHRNYPRGVYFLPVKPGASVQVVDDALNLWSGFSAEPVDGDWSPIDHHIKNVLASGDNEVYQYILDWCAHSIQHPEKQAGSVLVFRGKKRTGKGIFGNFLTHLWGNHGSLINNGKHLTGQFNGHLEQTCLLFLDEAIYAGDKKHESILKSLITEPELMVERKHHDAKQAPNRLKIIMATNETWAFPTSADDARALVCDVSDIYKGNQEYFEKLAAAMADPMVQGAFLADMLSRDISRYHSGNIPKTEALRDQIKESLDPIWQWWGDVLEAGELSEGAGFPAEVPQKELHDHFGNWCDSMKKSEYARMTLIRFTKDFASVYHKKRTSYERLFVLGSLEDAIAAFEREKLGVKPPVDEICEEDFSDVPF